MRHIWEVDANRTEEADAVIFRCYCGAWADERDPEHTYDENGYRHRNGELPCSNKPAAFKIGTTHRQE